VHERHWSAHTREMGDAMRRACDRKAQPLHVRRERYASLRRERAHAACAHNRPRASGTATPETAHGRPWCVRLLLQGYVAHNAPRSRDCGRTAAIGKKSVVGVIKSPYDIFLNIRLALAVNDARRGRSLLRQRKFDLTAPTLFILPVRAVCRPRSPLVVVSNLLTAYTRPRLSFGMGSPQTTTWRVCAAWGGANTSSWNRTTSVGRGSTLALSLRRPRPFAH